MSNFSGTKRIQTFEELDNWTANKRKKNGNFTPVIVNNPPVYLVTDRKKSTWNIHKKLNNTESLFSFTLEKNNRYGTVSLAYLNGNDFPSQIQIFLPRFF
jgi:hypothetical protein